MSRSARYLRPYQKRGGAKVDEYLLKKVKGHYEGLDLPMPKYAVFIKRAMEAGFEVWLKDTPHTVSKYVTLRKRGKSFKVRFSNHKPIEKMELAGTCDFWVGYNNHSVSSMEDAWKRVQEIF